MNQTINVKPTSKFLSDELSKLPSRCLFNKGITGCGGTTLEIESKRNSIILVPNINLVLNKCAAYKQLIGVYGEISESDLSLALQARFKYKKLIGTYDSLPKILNVLGEKAFDYFLLIDEYHILFNSYSFRYKPIKYILDNYSKFRDFCFMTATPLEDFNILEEIKDLPRITLTWPQAVKMKITIRSTYFTTKEILKEVNKCLSKDYNLHIFINSINTIRTIVKDLKDVNFRTICSKDAENKDLRSGGQLKVSSINSPVCKLNFYTATAFEGVDIYDPVGKTLIVSDTHIAQTLIDISTLMIQICGRLRDSAYKDEVLFICNTSNHRYVHYKQESEFMMDSDKLRDEAVIFERDINKSSIVTQNKQYDLYCGDPENYHIRYLGAKSNKVIYDPNLKKIDIQNFNIITKIFNNTISVIKNVIQQEKCEVKIENKELLKTLYKQLPALKVTYAEISKIILPIYFNNKIIADSVLNSISQYYTKSMNRINGKRVNIYDFTPLKAISIYLES